MNIAERNVPAEAAKREALAELHFISSMRSLMRIDSIFSLKNYRKYCYVGISLLILIGGFLILTVGAEALVRGSSSLALSG